MFAIASFNNKGGVGKTTLTCNVAAFFATNFKKRVLVVDCDPQCNATQLIIGQDAATDLYWNESGEPKPRTIKNVLSPIEDGDSSIDSTIEPILSSKNRFNVDLIPGHPGFSVIEDRLGAAWHDLLGGDIGGIRKTNWNSALCTAIASRYDMVFFDMGPSLGSINRSVLLGCTHFITPMGADIFSILGVRNISAWLSSWTSRYENGLALAEKNDPGKLKEFNIIREPGLLHGYLGYTMQQYITKSKQGERRPTKAYEEIINLVPAEVEQSLGKFLSPGVSTSTCKLGDVPHLYSLVPLAQAVAAPIFDLTSSDGLVGSQYSQRQQFGSIINEVCLRMQANIEPQQVEE